MKIGGLLKFSMLDYPGRLSAVIFCQGCSVRCGYCHNKNFQQVDQEGAVDFSAVLDFLSKRVGKLDAVVFSGGEPLIQHDLLASIEAVKKMHFLIGLHTAGLFPSIFEKVLGVCDWVGFDLKTVFEKYFSITFSQNSGIAAEKSFEMLTKNHDNFEIRTTFDERHISKNDLYVMAKMLREHKVKKWILQQCILRKKGVGSDRLPPPNAKIIENLKKFIEIELRK